jgi:hypothetical protein
MFVRELPGRSIRRCSGSVLALGDLDVHVHDVVDVEPVCLVGVESVCIDEERPFAKELWDELAEVVRKRLLQSRRDCAQQERRCSHEPQKEGIRDPQDVVHALTVDSFDG